MSVGPALSRRRMREIVIGRRFRGPARSGNGGYTSGLVAGLLDADAVEVTLRLPPPLDTPLRVERDGETVRVLDGDVLVAEAHPAEPDLEAPAPPAYAHVAALSAAQPGEADHPFPGCFVCGTGREEGDALRLRPVALGDGTVAAAWRVSERLADPGPLPLELVWAALDCPGGWAVQPDGSRGISVLGRLTARVLEPPSVGDECVVLGWPLPGGDDRRRHAGTAVFRDGELLAVGRAVWFLVENEVRDPS